MQNIDILIDYINKNEDYFKCNVMYSTPLEYISSLNI